MIVRQIFFVIFAVIISVSCSDDDSYSYHYELLAVEDAIVPEEFEYGRIYDIRVKYNVPDDCYVASEILYEYDGPARNIAVLSLVLDKDICEPLDLEDELTVRVQALQTSRYIFRFWQGDDENGDPIYLVKEVPVLGQKELSANEFEKTHTKM